MRRDQPEDPMEKRVAEETSRFGDIIRLDSTDTYADLASKTLKLFSKLPDKFDASFYFKVPYPSAPGGSLQYPTAYMRPLAPDKPCQCTGSSLRQYLTCQKGPLTREASGQPEEPYLSVTKGDFKISEQSGGRGELWCGESQVDDDVLVNLKALAAYLRERRTQGNLYMVQTTPSCSCQTHLKPARTIWKRSRRGALQQ